MTANCILERITQTESTNNDLLERWRAGALLDPVARIAHEQTAGKGRAGRVWLANPADSMCFSYAHPFNKTPAQLTGLSLVVGMAILTGIAQACKLDLPDLYQAGVRLKWPNDVLLNGAKFGGILIEGGQTKAGDPSWMIVGVGLNLKNAKAIEASLDQTGVKVGSIEQLLSLSNTSLPDTNCLWLTLLESLQTHFQKFEKEGFPAFQAEWLKWDAYANQSVCISGAGQKPIYGIAQGVDSHGALLLKQADKTTTIYAGDVSLRMQA